MLEKQKWRYIRQEGQSLIIKVGEVPADRNALDWYGECVNEFEKGVPNVLDKKTA